VSHDQVNHDQVNHDLLEPGTPDPAPDLHDLLQAYAVPDPSAAFVARTWSAVVSDRRARPDKVRRSATRWRRRFSLAASIAALVLCTIALMWDWNGGDGQLEQEPFQVTPVSFGALISASDGPHAAPPDSPGSALLNDFSIAAVYSAVYQGGTPR
jgi:hypothetical protein